MVTVDVVELGHHIHSEQRPVQLQQFVFEEDGYFLAFLVADLRPVLLARDEVQGVHVLLLAGFHMLTAIIKYSTAWAGGLWPISWRPIATALANNFMIKYVLNPPQSSPNAALAVRGGADPAGAGPREADKHYPLVVGQVENTNPES